MAFQPSPEHQPEQSVNPLEKAEQKLKQETAFELSALKDELGVPDGVENVLETQNSSESAEAEQLLANIDAPAFAGRTQDNQRANSLMRMVMNKDSNLAYREKANTNVASFLKQLSEDDRGLGIKYMAS